MNWLSKLVSYPGRKVGKHETPNDRKYSFLNRPKTGIMGARQRPGVGLGQWRKR